MNDIERTEIIELSRCADPRTGPAYFLKNYFQIQHPVKGAMLFGLYDFQEELLDSIIENPLSINLIARQLGKTSVTAGYLLWDAMFNSDRTILVGSHNFTSAKEIIQRIRFGYTNCPDFLKPSTHYFNKMNIELDNGSRIIAQAITENLGRGMAISTLYLDEFAYARDICARESWDCLRPSFVTGTRVIINSTANYDDDFFAELWKEACQLENEFVPLSIDCHRHPERTHTWELDTINLIGEARFRQEHENEFISNVEIT